MSNATAQFASTDGVAPFVIGSAKSTTWSTMSDVMNLMGTRDAPLGDLLDLPVPVRRLRAGETLFHEGARVESVQFVRSGSFKISHTEHDGYEQVLGFASRTDMLGIDALCLEGHPNAAIALEDSTTFVILVRDLFAHSERTPAFGRTLHMLFSSALARQSEQADVMAAVSSEMRLARFLLHLSRRMTANGQSPRRLLLRMSRRDIASYLGVAHETISRSFKMMGECGLLDVDNRDVEILDLPKLQAFSQGARRQVDDGSGEGRKARGVLGWRPVPVPCARR
ncbi:MAG: Crp/Fnr family transcriptional regulator [Pseudomonadota bacterium]